MAETESVLLERFAATGDAAAFSEIVRRHAGLVYCACLRVLADRDKAADATQDTFLQLMRKAGEITGSIPSWLHRVAIRKAIDLIRSDSSRRRSERRYADVKQHEARSWQDLEPHVDEALDSLDEQTKDLLIQYFFEGRSMVDLAAERGLSHPTISRRIEAGVSRLRDQLRRRGVVVAAAGVGALLSENAAQGAPAAVVQELGKMSLLGTKIGGASAAGSASTYVLAASKVKVVVAAAVAVVGVGSMFVYKHLTRPPESPAPGAVIPDRSRPERIRPQAVRELQQPEPPSTTVQAESPPAEIEAAEADQDVQAATVDEEPPWPETGAPVEEDKLDLSSPEATVRSFTKAIASGNAEAALACMLPGGIDYEDIQEILYAEPGDREYDMKLWFESLDPDAEMSILSTEGTEHHTTVVWEVTFKKDFEMGGRTLSAGETMELDAGLVESDGKWLIDGI
ncbi:MAG: sigma-70 family RNA polymerase sigma factor [Phycisphaerales bacterium]|nr:MAG: sigma-70 family RNA polymerase sigma factor [Phycisphaerales bacterium]